MKKKLGRPKVREKWRSKIVTLRFDEDELKSISDYIKRNKIKNRAAWIRELIKNEISK